MKFTSNEFKLMVTTIQDDLYRRCSRLNDDDFKSFILFYYKEKSSVLSELYQMFVLEDVIELDKDDITDIITNLCDRYDRKACRANDYIKSSAYALIQLYLSDILDYILY